MNNIVLILTIYSIQKIQIMFLKGFFNITLISPLMNVKVLKILLNLISCVFYVNFLIVIKMVFFLLNFCNNKLPCFYLIAFKWPINTASFTQRTKLYYCNNFSNIILHNHMPKVFKSILQRALCDNHCLISLGKYWTLNSIGMNVFSFN